MVGHDEEIEIDEKTNIFPNLKCLILIKTGLTWKNLFRVVKAFKDVQELILCKNDLSDTENIPENFDVLQKMTFLNVEETNISDFAPLLKFSHLENL